MLEKYRQVVVLSNRIGASRSRFKLGTGLSAARQAVQALKPDRDGADEVRTP